MTVLGAVFPPDLPPEQLGPVARAADRAGLEQLWLWEDCFKESGIAAAAAVLAWTDRLSVGIGLLPVPLRNVALTAMELATLERLFPGRLLAGVGHGVGDWMAQVGALAQSPMTLLREYTTALRLLLHGETVTVAGRYVRLSEVALDWPPTPPPPLLVGAVRERTMRLAGELGDGVILTGDTTPADLGEALVQLRAGRGNRGRHAVDPNAVGDVVVFTEVEGSPSAPELAGRIGEMGSAGATHVILHSVDGGADLETFVQFIARDVRPLVRP